MTTNVFDRTVPKLATDSRWSIDRPTFMVYVDDTGCDKIALFNNTALMFSGDGGLIQEWKDWIASDPTSRTNKPRRQSERGSISLCIVHNGTGDILYEYRQQVTLPEARFSGTGHIPAYNCWKINRDPCKAVESAIKVDRYSGGKVVFANLLTQDNNVKNSATITDVSRLISERGYMLDTASNMTPIPIKQAAKRYPDVQKLLDEIASGSVFACSPYEGMDVPWSEDEIRKLDEVLDRIINKEI